MTKKEKQELHSKKCIVEKNNNIQLGRGAEERYIVSFSLTKGELIALNQCTRRHTSSAAPGFDKILDHCERDVEAFLFNGMQRMANK